MYLAKELCDLKQKEIAAQFGTESYGTVGWACHGVASRIKADAKLRKRISSIRRSCQQKDLTLIPSSIGRDEKEFLPFQLY